MAKKKEENIFVPMAMSAARDVRSYNTYRTGWYGINRMDADTAEYYGEEFNTGYFTKARNIDCSDSPILRSARSWERVAKFRTTAAEDRSMVGIAHAEGLLFYIEFIAISSDQPWNLRVWALDPASGKSADAVIPTDFDDNTTRRSVIRFNKYVSDGSEILGTFEPMLLIFPDCIEVPINNVKEAIAAGEAGFEGGNNFYRDDTDNVKCPTIYHATAYKGRVFGVGGATVYASAYNDYTNWDVDTADDIDSENAWCSSTQSNVKATDEFTGITTYDNNVIAFKRAFTHRITGTKNPFRVVDVTDDGAIGADTIACAGGALMYISDRNVMMYTGGVPKAVGEPLGFGEYTYEQVISDTLTDRLISACKGDEYYFHRRKEIYSFNVSNGLWSVMEKPDLLLADDYAEYIPDDSWNFERIDSGAVVALVGGNSALWCVVKGHYKIYNGSTYVSNDVYFIYRLSDKRDRSFYAETVSSTKISTTYSLDTKRMRSARLLCSIAEGGDLKVYMLYDGEEFNPDSPGEAQLLFDSKGRTGDVLMKTYIRRGRGTSYRLALMGKGDVRVNVLDLQVSYGGKDAYNEKV